MHISFYYFRINEKLPGNYRQFCEFRQFETNVFQVIFRDCFDLREAALKSDAVAAGFEKIFVRDGARREI
jgi:hypothetical protein